MTTYQLRLCKILARFFTRDASITYTNLDEEVRLVNEPKSIAYVGQLGKKCRVTGCEEEIVVSVHTNCGYGVKLSWICKKQHRYCLCPTQIFNCSSFCFFFQLICPAFFFTDFTTTHE